MVSKWRINIALYFTQRAKTPLLQKHKKRESLTDQITCLI